MPTETKNIPYGQWPSPIQPGVMSRRTRLDDVQWTRDGDGIIWQEGRGSQSVLVYQAMGDAPRDLFSEPSARGGVGYGGGAFSTGPGAVYFVDKGKQIFRLDLPFGRPYPITPVYGGVAAPTVSPDGASLVYVYSDGQTDLLAMVDTQGVQWPMKLVQGADFYMQPAWHPSGKRLAWVEWDHPAMPWQSTRLMLANLDGKLPAITHLQVIAGQANGVYTQPQFSPDGRWLSYLADAGEWDQLVLLDLETGQAKTLYQGEKSLLTPAVWVQGVRSFGWSPDSRSVYCLENFAGQARLLRVDMASGQATTIKTAPYTWLEQVSISPQYGQVALIASSPQDPERVLSLEGETWRAHAYNDAWMFAPSEFCRPEVVEWKGKDGGSVFGNYYPPYHPGIVSDGLPPLVVYVHGGPSSLTALSFSPSAQFFSSRGIAFLEVNYRGSSGFGRSYLDALNGRWGELDTADIVWGAKSLADQGKVDPARMVIFGGSAGGFAVLNALYQYPGEFKAGIAMYPVADLISISIDTHKFELHYNDSLVGKLPADIKIYKERSALYNAEKIVDPLIIFHGKDDKVVPVGQSEAIVARMRQNGIPVDLYVYDGEGHGFRKPETIADVFEKIERFLVEKVIFDG